MRNRWKLLAAGCVVAIAAGVACSGGEALSGGTDTSNDMDAPGNAGAGGSHRALASDDFAQPAAAGVEGQLPPPGPSVIKTAEVSLEVGDSELQDSIRSIVAIARDNGGYVLSTDENHERATVVLRIPAQAFETALADAEAVGEVSGESVTGEDVGQEFVDLDARLRNFEAQEAVLLRLMARSTSVADTLRVQRELQDVQLEIERLRGRLRFLRDQTDLSTITVRLSEAGSAVKPAGSLQRAWRRALDALSAIASGTVVVVVVLVPLALVAFLVLFVVRYAWARLPSIKARDV